MVIFIMYLNSTFIFKDNDNNHVKKKRDKDNNNQTLNQSVIKVLKHIIN